MPTDHDMDGNEYQVPSDGTRIHSGKQNRAAMVKVGTETNLHRDADAGLSANNLQLRDVIKVSPLASDETEFQRTESNAVTRAKSRKLNQQAARENDFSRSVHADRATERLGESSLPQGEMIEEQPGATFNESQPSRNSEGVTASNSGGGTTCVQVFPPGSDTAVISTSVPDQSGGNAVLDEFRRLGAIELESSAGSEFMPEAITEPSEFIIAQRNDKSLAFWWRRAKEGSSSFVIRKGVLFKRVNPGAHSEHELLLAVPAEYRKQILERAHISPEAGCHQGIARTKMKINRVFAWPNDGAEIESYVRGCLTCARIAPGLKRMSQSLMLLRCSSNSVVRRNVGGLSQTAMIGRPKVKIKSLNNRSC